MKENILKLDTLDSVSVLKLGFQACKFSETIGILVFSLTGEKNFREIIRPWRISIIKSSKYILVIIYRQFMKNVWCILK